MEEYEQLLASTRPYSALLIVNGIVSTVIYLFTVTTIVLKSPKKNFCPRVQFILLSWATSGYLIALILALWQPVMLLPYSFGFSVGIVRNAHGALNGVMYEVIMSSLMNFMLCFCIFSAYQNSALTIKCPLGRFLRDTPPLYSGIVYGCAWLFLSVCTAGVMTSVGDSCLNIDRVLMSQDLNETIAFGLDSSTLALLEVVRHEEHSLHYSYLRNAKFGLMHVCLGIFLIAGLFILIFILAMHVRIGREIAEMESTALRTTHNLQVQLFRMYASNTLLMTVFYVVPFVIIGACLLGWLTDPLWSMAAYTVAALYTPVFMWRIIWCIAPYRRHAIQVGRQLIGRSKSGPVLLSYGYNNSSSDSGPDQHNPSSIRKLSSASNNVQIQKF